LLEFILMSELHYYEVRHYPQRQHHSEHQEHIIIPLSFYFVHSVEVAFNVFHGFVFKLGKHFLYALSMASVSFLL